MNEVIERLVQQGGFSADQAKKALEIITGFVKEKFPMLEGAIDNMFNTQANDSPFGE